MKCLCILFCLLAPWGFAGESPSFLGALRTELQAGIKTLPKDTRSADLAKLADIEKMLTEDWSQGPADRSTPGGRFPSLLEALVALEATTQSTAVDALCEKLITDVQNTLTRESQKFQDRFHQSVRDAFTAGLAATSAKDLDAPLATLNALQKEAQDLGRQDSSPTVAQAAQQILTTFQNGLLGLSLVDSGHRQNPSRELQEMAFDSWKGSLLATVMPRSEFLEEMQNAAAKLTPLKTGETVPKVTFEQRASDLIGGIKALDDMAGVLDKIELLKTQQKMFRGSYLDTTAVTHLRTCIMIYQKLRTDGAVSTNELLRISQKPEMHRVPEDQPTQGIREMLFRYALPKVLGAPSDLIFKEGESTADYLQRVRAAALVATNWSLYSNALRYASEKSDTFRAPDEGAFSYFKKAVNLETAGLRKEAVRYYRDALGTGAQQIPINYIREHMEAIRKNFPEDYASALKIEPTARQVAMPMPRQPQQAPSPNKLAPTVENIHYAGLHERQVLDFYQAKSDKPTPLMFYIHGGGWASGDKNNPDGLQTCLDAGISVVSINYRYIVHANEEGVQPPVKAPMEDAARALQFVRSMAKEWNLDKERIGAVGGSAGACTSLWLAFHPDMADPKSKDPVSHESTRLWCVSVFVPQTTLDPQQMMEWTPNSEYGGHAFGFSSFGDYLSHRDQILPWIAEYSPYALVTKDDPPVFLDYGEAPALGKPQKDPTHSANFGVKLQEHCQEIGVPCELMYPGAPNVKHPGGVFEFLIEKLKAPTAK